MFGKAKKGIGIASKDMGMGIDESVLLAAKKSVSEYVERWAHAHDKFSIQYKLDTTGFAAMPRSIKNIELTKHKSYCEAVEKFSVMKFWDNSEISFGSCKDKSNENITYIFPKINDSSLYVCIAVLTSGKKAWVGSSCSSSLCEASNKAKLEALAHKDGCALLQKGKRCDLEVYEKRLNYLMHFGSELLEKRLSKDGTSEIKIPDIEINRQVECKKYSRFYIHQTRLKGQKNFLDDNFIDVGYV